MRFIEISGFTAKPDQRRALQEWVAANQEALARTYPQGTGLLGFFAAVYSSEKQAGDLFMLEELDSYAAVDRVAAVAKDSHGEHARLMNELLAFADPNPNAPFSKILLKDLVAATVFDLPAETKEVPEPLPA